MPKYLGYAAELALGQDAEGNVSQWYHPGDDIQTIDSAVEGWLINQGYTFDPMPAPPQMLTFEDPGSGPANMLPSGSAPADQTSASGQQMTPSEARLQQAEESQPPDGTGTQPQEPPAAPQPATQQQQAPSQSQQPPAPQGGQPQQPPAQPA